MITVYINGVPVTMTLAQYIMHEAKELERIFAMAQNDPLK